MTDANTKLLRLYVAYELLFGIAFVVLVLGLETAYVARRHGWSGLVHHSARIAAILAPVILIFGVTIIYKKYALNRRKMVLALAASLPLAAVVGIGSAASFYIWQTALGDLLTWTATQLGPTATHKAQEFGTIYAIVLVLGGLLFWFRLRRRGLYGTTEALLGVLIAPTKYLGHTATDPDVWIALLTASVYLIVRGFDNIHQGVTGEPKDPAAAKIASWIGKRVAPLAPLAPLASRV